MYLPVPSQLCFPWSKFASCSTKSFVFSAYITGPLQEDSRGLGGLDRNSGATIVPGMAGVMEVSLDGA